MCVPARPPPPSSRASQERKNLLQTKRPERREEKHGGDVSKCGGRGRRVVLRCIDGVKVAVPVALARQRSVLVAAAAADHVAVVDVPGYVYGPVVAKVAAYWEGRAAATQAADKAGAAFDAAFLAGLQHDAVVDLIHAAHHLGDAALFDLFRFRA